MKNIATYAVRCRCNFYCMCIFLLKDMKQGKIWGVLTWRGKSEVNGEEAQTSMFMLVASRNNYAPLIV